MNHRIPALDHGTNVTQTQSACDRAQDLDDDTEMQVDEEPSEAGVRHSVVVDTNILIGHLDYVKKMLSHGLGAMGFPVLVIPYVVVQELDSLKSRGRTRAVHFINACLKSEEPGLRVQSVQQAEEAQRRQGLTARNNDDQVLQCCLQYGSLHPDRALVLCTDDVNLRNKSLPAGVKALSQAELAEEVERYGRGTNPRTPDVHAQTVAAATLCERRGGWQQQPERAECLDPTRATERRGGQTEDRTREISSCVSLMEDCLREALSAVLEAEMKVQYDDLWREIVYLKPPWSLQDVLRCMEKHWIAVFGDIFQRRYELLSGLVDFFTPGATVDRGTMLAALREAATMLEMLRCQSGYGDRIPAAVSTLNSITLQLQPRAEEEGEAAPVAQQDVWEAEGVPMDVEFTTAELLDCLAQQESWERLGAGGTRLEKLEEKLKLCEEANGQPATGTSTWGECQATVY